MRRREFIAGLGGAAAAAARSARAGARAARRRADVYDRRRTANRTARIAALHHGLQEAGWSVGRNVRIDVRWSGGDIARLRLRRTILEITPQ